jgi:hypothetical protein
MSADACGRSAGKNGAKTLDFAAILGTFVKVNKCKLSDILGASVDFVRLMASLRQLLVTMGGVRCDFVRRADALRCALRYN